MRLLKKIIIAGCILFASSSIKAKSAQEMSEFPTLTILQHDLVDHKMTLLRKKETKPHEFGQLLREIALLIGYEITRSLDTKQISIETPMSKTIGRVVDESQIVIVPILRAGLGMAEGLHKLLPAASFGHIGLYRHHETKKPVEYLFKIPPVKNQLFIVVDPMLATGNSAVYGVDKLIKAGVPAERIRFMALLVAPEGMRTFQKAHPTIPVYAAALDDKLDKNAYIIPGLGDAGDRLYGTE
ncbi:uracil phosphoribosyltransferase [Candidatus Nucleicultrix amoebiphila]|jgi:uracil phosphoribosyltransferase|nr:uracil phosphoribosyltransferase [Candidatus Nucleicultrix amoebiphila]